MEENIIRVELNNIEIDRNQDNLPRNRKAILELYPDTVEATISVIAYNRLETTKTCVESILKYTTDVSYKLILVYNENEAGAGILDYFKSVEYENKLIIHMTQNAGLALATKEVLKYVEGKYYVGLGNDNIVTSNWLSNLIKCAESDERIGMVTPVSSNVSNRQNVELKFSDYDEMQEEAKKYNVSDPSKWEERLRLVTICPLITRDCLESIGCMFDLGLFHEFLDDELSFRIRRAGYKCMLAGDTWVHHDHPFVSRDIQKDIEAFKKGNKEFKEKFFGLESWANTNNFHEEYANALTKCSSKIPQILGVDVKCGAPILQIKNKLRTLGITNAEMYAYTQQPEFYLDLQTVFGENNVVCGTEDEILARYIGQEFDYIVLGDYINKYKNPKLLLKNLSVLLKKDGQLFLSLKNVYDIFSIYQLTGYFDIHNPEMYLTLSSDDLFRMAEQLGLNIKYFTSYKHGSIGISQEELSVIHESLASFARVSDGEVMRRLTYDRHAYVITKKGF